MLPNPYVRSYVCLYLLQNFYERSYMRSYVLTNWHVRLYVRSYVRLYILSNFDGQLYVLPSLYAKKEKKRKIITPLYPTPRTPSSVTWVPQSRLAFGNHCRVGRPQAFGLPAITILSCQSFACRCWLRLPAAVQGKVATHKHL